MMIAAHCEQSFHVFCQEAWRWTGEPNPFQDNWHIQAICEHLEAVSRGEIKRLVINIPPRHMKTKSVAVLWPAWDWIQNPWRKWMAATYAHSLSMDAASQHMLLVMSDWYQERWGNIVRLDKNKKMAKDEFYNTHGGARVSTSVGGVATGKGADIILIDDPIKANEAQSMIVREGCWTWWTQTMSTRLNDPKTGCKVIMMQRLHEDDLVGRVLKYETGEDWNTLVIPTRYERSHPVGIRSTIGFKDPRTTEGELIWPQRFAEEYVKNLESSLGSYGTAGQLQQRPAPADGGIFKKSWFVKQSSLPDAYDRLFISMDAAFKDGNENDYVAIQLWGSKGPTHYLVDQIHDRMDFTSSVKALARLYKQAGEIQPVNGVLIEDKANGSAIINVMRKRLSGVVAITPKGGKMSRAQAVACLVEAGNVVLRDGHIEGEKLMEESAMFPNGTHDDQVDAMTQYLNYYTQRFQPFASNTGSNEGVIMGEDVQGDLTLEEAIYGRQKVDQVLAAQNAVLFSNNPSLADALGGDVFIGL